MIMEFEFEPKKSESNLRKHGIGFKDTITAEELDKLFDEGEDISQFLDWPKAQRPLLNQFTKMDDTIYRF
jgi:hypothetical protein